MQLNHKIYNISPIMPIFALQYLSKMTNISHIHTQTEQLIRKVGDFICAESAHFSSDKIEYKGKNNLVSYVDKTAEKMLVTGCSDILPNCGFINEETGEHKGTNDFVWIIDPLDGTTNFTHGLPVYAISVALQQKEETILGFVYYMSMNEMFSAIKGQGAFLNGKQIFVSERNNIGDSLIATGFPYMDFAWMDEYIETLKAFLRASQGMRRMGSAAIDLAYVACGRFEGFWENKLSAWDVAAGVLLVEEAGGKVTDFLGGNNYLFGKQIIASNRKIHAEMRKIIMKQFVEK